LRYQLRKDKPWEVHLKQGKENIKFRKNRFVVHENAYSIDDVELILVPRKLFLYINKNSLF